MENQAKAVTKFMRIPPRKARLAADLIRGLPVEKALVQLAFCRMKGGLILKKTVESALANATMKDLKKDDLRVLQVMVNEGPRLKRAKSKSKGGRVPIIKRTSHFTVVLGHAKIGQAQIKE